MISQVLHVPKLSKLKFERWGISEVVEDKKFLGKLKRMLSNNFWLFYSRFSVALGLYLFMMSVLFKKNIFSGFIGLWAVYVGCDVALTKKV
jgi:hypothetical protein